MILFVHPRTDMTLKEILPMSVPAMINRVRKLAPVTGRFYDELKDREIRQAQVIIMDVHWFVGMKSAIELSHRFKQLNPGVRIIVGGASATVFTPYLMRDSAFDYIIRGDGDIPLYLLVDAILNDKPVEKVPNVVGRDFTSEDWYGLEDEDLDEGDFRDISWFPTLEKRTLWLHRWSRGRAYSIHPFIMVFRGCPMGCNFCLGSRGRQQKVFRRSWVLRSAEKVREDLQYFGDHPDYEYVNTFHDFCTMPPADYVEELLAGQSFDVDIRHEFYKCPTERATELFCNAFRGGKVCFSIDEMHATSAKLPDIDTLIARIKQVKNTGRFEPWISYVQGILQYDPNYQEALQRVIRETGAQPDRVDFWWDVCPKPNAEGIASEAEYHECIRRTNRYWLFNRVYRASIFAWAAAPRLTNWALHAYSNNNLGVPIRPLTTESGQ